MAQCLTPFLVHSDNNAQNGTNHPVACGRCVNCVKRRISGWSFRLRKESQQHLKAEFVLLTYSDPPRTAKRLKTLCKRDIQLFFKRLRQLYWHRQRIRPRIVYYVCGEYGPATARPHYHALIFGADRSYIEEAWSSAVKNGYTSFGYDTSEAAIGYTLKYMSKPTRIPMFKGDDRVPEFALMSKGIGSNYLTDAMRKWHRSDPVRRFYVPIEDGKKIALPRYYKKMLFTDAELKSIGNQMTKIMENDDFNHFDYSSADLDLITQMSKAFFVDRPANSEI